MSSKKLLAIGLDAANPFLLRRWAADGILPTLAALISKGLTIETESVEGMYVGASWPSFYTGTDPSDHGIYWLDRLIPGTYREQRCRPRDFGRKEAIWEVLDRAGRRVVVLDVPLSRISPGLRGRQIVEWGVHDAAFGFRTRPRSLGRWVHNSVGPHPAPVHCDRVRSAEEHKDFADQLSAGALARAKLTNDLLASDDWDFALQVFSETHCAGHQLWHTHDPAHPAFAQTTDSLGEDLVRRVYVAVDRALGRILDRLDPTVTVAVFTLHGMSSACGGSLLLPQILSRMGVAGTHAQTAETDHCSDDRDPDRAEPRHPSSGGRPLDMARRAYHLFPEAARARLYGMRQWINQRWLGRGSPIAGDPARACAFYIGFGVGSTFSGIRLNLRGREPSGQLEPGSEADHFCEQVESALLGFTRPESGESLVRRVLRTRDLYDGPLVHWLPDLLVEWETEPAMGTTAVGAGAGAMWRAVSDEFGMISILNDYCRTGEHRIEGMTVFQGPGIRTGHLGRVVSTLDLAPTFARLLGSSMDGARGQPIPELLSSANPTTESTT